MKLSIKTLIKVIIAIATALGGIFGAETEPDSAN